MDLATDQRSFGHRLLSSRPGVEQSWLLQPASWGLRFAANLCEHRELLRNRPVGCIVVQQGKLTGVQGRWWPKWASLAEVYWANRRSDRQTGQGAALDQCRLYYHAPITARGFLTLDYVKATQGASLSSLYAATLVLDEIARLRSALATVAEVSNQRISDRLLRRWGWQEHCPHLAGRHYIKRYYGQYPTVPVAWQSRIGLTATNKPQT